jgi:hypothetical protein
MRQPPLKSLHATIALKLDQLRPLTTEVIVLTLKPGHPDCLRARPDGTILNGHHRICILRERGFAVDELAREVIPKEEERES